jgi:hypothetical protein
MNKNLYRFLHYDMRGTIEGLFFASEEEVQALFGEEVYFGEVLGKHSDVVLGITPEQISKEEIPEEVSQGMFHHFGETVSGYNPCQILRSML